MGGDEDGYATVSGIIYELPELSARGWINTSSRFVEKDNLRFVEDGNREGEFLFPTERQRAYKVVAMVGKL